MAKSLHLPDYRMVRTGFQQSDAASIEIVDFQCIYRPGDTVIGHVIAKAAFAPGEKAGRSRVEVRLSGRAKTRILPKRPSMKTNSSEGTAVFF
jgi:hypothetical protein